jgi:transcription elongation factor GreA
MEKHPMTPEGHAKLKEELGRLKTEERPRVIREIGTAREHGDLSENAEYHAAKDRQGMIEARISELESKIGLAEVIDISDLSGDHIQFGAKVTVVDEETEEESTYQIVGADEADVNEGRLSISSPLARALIGKSAGDSIEINTPGGARNYEILAVEYK